MVRAARDDTEQLSERKTQSLRKTKTTKNTDGKPTCALKRCPHHMKGECAGLERQFDLVLESKGIGKAPKCEGACEMLTVRSHGG